MVAATPRLGRRPIGLGPLSAHGLPLRAKRTRGPGGGPLLNPRDLLPTPTTLPSATRASGDKTVESVIRQLSTSMPSGRGRVLRADVLTTLQSNVILDYLARTTGHFEPETLRWMASHVALASGFSVSTTLPGRYAGSRRRRFQTPSRRSARSNHERRIIGRTSTFSVTRGERKVIVILTDPALIDRISPDRRRIEMLQNHISTVATNKIVDTGARHSSFCTQN